MNSFENTLKQDLNTYFQEFSNKELATPVSNRYSHEIFSKWLKSYATFLKEINSSFDVEKEAFDEEFLFLMEIWHTAKRL